MHDHDPAGLVGNHAVINPLTLLLRGQPATQDRLDVLEQHAADLNLRRILFGNLRGPVGQLKCRSDVDRVKLPVLGPFLGGLADDALEGGGILALRRQPRLGLCNLDFHSFTYRCCGSIALHIGDESTIPRRRLA